MCVCAEEFRSSNARLSTDQPFRTRKIYWFYKTKQERVENISDILPTTSKSDSALYNLLFSNSKRPFLRSNSIIISFFARKLLKTLSITYTHRVHAGIFFFLGGISRRPVSEFVGTLSPRCYFRIVSRNVAVLYARERRRSGRRNARETASDVVSNFSTTSYVRRWFIKLRVPCTPPTQ